MTQRRSNKSSTSRSHDSVDSILAALERQGSTANVAGMARFGIESPRVFGVSVGDVRAMAKRIGPNHELALDLWKTGWYEARMLAAFIAEPAKVTTRMMDAWVRDFDNWAITDTVCFSLFDQTPHAWSSVDRWSARTGEFQRRAAFALLASMALHDRTGSDAEYRKRLPLIRKYASDERNFVRKGVSWALHGIGCRSAELHADATRLATELARSSDPSERWVGRDALRKLSSAATKKRVKRSSSARSPKARTSRRGAS